MYQPSQPLSSLSITSFFFGPCFRRMKELLIVLSFLPKLTHLKLILWTDFTDSVIDGSQWERFITERLPYLERFEFFFDDLTFLEGQSFNFELYLQSFRSPFWIDEKQWYVMCDFIQSVSIVRLYSLPICNASLAYFLYSQKISFTTLPPTAPQRYWTDQVQEINIRLYDTTDLNLFKAVKSSSSEETLTNRFLDYFRTICHRTGNFVELIRFPSVWTVDSPRTSLRIYRRSSISPFWLVYRFNFSLTALHTISPWSSISPRFYDKRQIFTRWKSVRLLSVNRWWVSVDAVHWFRHRWNTYKSLCTVATIWNTFSRNSRNCPV